MIEFEFGCVICREAIPRDEMLGVWLSLGSDNEAGQQCWIHVECARTTFPGIFENRMLLNPKIAELAGIEPFPNEEEEQGVREAIRQYYNDNPHLRPE